jgi:hypothetical protein
MRTQLVDGLTLLFAGVACLAGPGTIRAQSPPVAAPAQVPGAWQRGPAPYYPGYNPYAPNPSLYTNYPQGPAASSYPQGSSGFSAQTEVAVPYVPVMPLVPIGPGPLPGEDAHDGAAHERGPVATKDCFWFSAGYDSSWIRPWRINTPLLTQGALADDHPGALGQPGTTILFGDRADFGYIPGVRLGVGASLDGGEHLFVELDARYLFPSHVKTTASSDATGLPIIARPFFNTNEEAERAFATSKPGVPGSTDIDARSEFLGAELNARYACRPSDCVRFDVLGGFRFLRLNESLTIRDQLQPMGTVRFEGNPTEVGDAITDVDSFKTVNHFYGLQLGGQASWEGQCLFASAFGKAAIGWTDQEVDINGATALFTPAQAFVAGGGVLALPSNIGQHTRTVLGFVPEAGVTLGVKVTPCLRLTATYSFLFWNEVVRPGGQIDRAVNPTMVPTDNSFGMLTGPARPAFHFSDETFWVHTLTVGLDLHF